MKMARSRMGMMPGAGSAGVGAPGGVDIMQMQSTVLRVDAQMSQLQSDMQTVLRLLKHEEAGSPGVTPSRQPSPFSPSPILRMGHGQGSVGQGPLEA